MTSVTNKPYRINLNPKELKLRISNYQILKFDNKTQFLAYEKVAYELFKLETDYIKIQRKNKIFSKKLREWNCVDFVRVNNEYKEAKLQNYLVSIRQKQSNVLGRCSGLAFALDMLNEIYIITDNNYNVGDYSDGWIMAHPVNVIDENFSWSYKRLFDYSGNED